MTSMPLALRRTLHKPTLMVLAMVALGPLLTTTATPVTAVRLLLEAGVDPDVAINGGPSIELAVASGNAHTVRLLLDAGANPNRRRP